MIKTTFTFLLCCVLWIACQPAQSPVEQPADPCTPPAFSKRLYRTLTIRSRPGLKPDTAVTRYLFDAQGRLDSILGNTKIVYAADGKVATVLEYSKTAKPSATVAYFYKDGLLERKERTAFVELHGAVQSIRTIEHYEWDEKGHEKNGGWKVRQIKLCSPTTTVAMSSKRRHSTTKTTRSIFCPLQLMIPASTPSI